MSPLVLRSLRGSLLAALLAGVSLPTVAVACIWDYDTIKSERSRFPGTLELITGKFLRHSPEFYEWRIQNRLKRIESDPSVALLDDLAAAYDKTGEHEKAIETALKTEELHPGRYETAANLGTFYLHAGNLEEGIRHIERALKINPDAHFGRERTQKQLAEYVLQRRQGGPLRLPLSDVTIRSSSYQKARPSYPADIKDTFEGFLRSDPREPITKEEGSAAIKGILGMMRFGKHDSPVLLEALGTLLVQPGLNLWSDAKLLAARAFLKASYGVSDTSEKEAYRAMAATALLTQTLNRQTESITLEQVEEDFQRELGEADAWYKDLRTRELAWIRDSADPEAEFARLYDADPEVTGMNARDPLTHGERLIIWLVVSVVVVVTAYLVIRRRSVRRSRQATKPEGDPHV